MTYWVKGYRKLCPHWRRQPSVTRPREVGCGCRRLRWLPARSCSSAAVFAHIKPCSLTCSHDEIAIFVSGCVLPFLFGLIKSGAGGLSAKAVLCVCKATCCLQPCYREEGWDCGAVTVKAIGAFFWKWNKRSGLAEICARSRGILASALTRKAFYPQGWEFLVRTRNAVASHVALGLDTQLGRSRWISCSEWNGGRMWI